MMDLPNLKDDLIRVEERLSREVGSDVEFLTEVANHLIPAGGKRIRPGFTITAASLWNQTQTQNKDQNKNKNKNIAVSEDVIAGAVAVELVHLGSLYHDDVMDGAKKRRNVDSVNAKYGDHIAILAGDFLLARASILAADLGAPVSRLLAVTIASLCEGQILEHQDIHNLKRTPSAYMEAIKGKTASLLAAACEIGAMVGMANPDQDQQRERHITQQTAIQLGEFGHAYGIAFQIIDDISDLITDGSEMGKPGGNDIAEGNYTLPVIYALQEDETGELENLLQKTIPEEGSSSPSAVWDNISKARERASIHGPKKAIQDAKKFTGKAKDVLLKLPESSTTQAFGKALDYLVNKMDEIA